MIGFIKDALIELEHVVWPTPNESRKYMVYTVGTIIIIGVFLAITGNLIRSGLVLSRDQFPHKTELTTTVSGEEAATSADVEEVLNKIGVKNTGEKTVLSTGSLESDSTSSASGSQK